MQFRLRKRSAEPVSFRNKDLIFIPKSLQLPSLQLAWFCTPQPGHFDYRAPRTSICIPGTTFIKLSGPANLRAGSVAHLWNTLELLNLTRPKPEQSRECGVIALYGKLLPSYPSSE